MVCNSFRLCITGLKANGNKVSKCPYSKCLTSYDSRKKVVVEENRKKYKLINPDADKIANFVELKGTDLRHALEQIEATIDRLLPGLPNYRIFARVVTSNRTLNGV